MQTATSVVLLLLVSACAIPRSDTENFSGTSPGIAEAEVLRDLLAERDRESENGRRQLPRVSPAALVGVSTARVSNWLGKPSLIWREGENALWRYQGQRCVILLFMDSTETVREVRLGRRDGPGDRGCEDAINQHIAGRQIS